MSSDRFKSMSFEFWLTTFRGELAALTAALLWAIASLVYTRIGQNLSPLMLNLVKCVMGVGLILLTLALRGDRQPTLGNLALVLLLLSGALGIGLGDTFYFEALNCIGPRRTLLMESLAPPLSALLALVFLNETIGWLSWLGIILTIVGVTWVISERTPIPERSFQPKQRWRGVGFGLLAAISQAGGAVLSRSALLQGEIDTLWSTLVRLAAGIGIMLLWLPTHSRPEIPAKSMDFWLSSSGRQLLAVIAATAFFSTFLGIWLQQTSLKYAATGIAQALSSTSPLFVLPLIAWTGERISTRAVLGVFIALGGIGLLFRG